MIEAHIIRALLLAASVAGVYFYGLHEGVTRERDKWEVKQAAATKADLDSLTGAVKAGNVIAQATQAAVVKVKTERLTDREVIAREINANPELYASDCLPPALLVQYNRVAAGVRVVPTGPAVGKPDSGVPKGNGPAATGQQASVPSVQPDGRPRHLR